MSRKTLDSRAESYKTSFDRHLDLVEEAEAKGDLAALRRNLEYAVDAWLKYTECAASPAIRKSREDNLEKLIDWLESIPEHASDLPPPASPGDKPARGKGRGPARAAEGKDGDEGPSFIPVERPNLRFDDIAGLEDVKEEIRLKMIYPYTHPEIAARYRIKRGGGILLYGPPGTGKTMMARAVAGEIEAAFFTVKPSEIMSKWVGDSEQNIDRLFAGARQHERSIVFIDEIEALVPARREVQSGVMTRLVPQILAELEGFGSDGQNPLLFIGATNEPWSLDPAVLRPGRFDEKVYVGLPDFAARLKIVELGLAERPLGADMDLEMLADITEGYSGADIKNLCEKAAADVFLRAVKQDGADASPTITMGDVERVLKQTRPSVSPDDVQRFDQYRQASGWPAEEA